MEIAKNVVLDAYKCYYYDDLNSSNTQTIPALTFLLSYDDGERVYHFGKIDVLNNDDVKWQSMDISVLRDEYYKSEEDAVKFCKIFESATSKFAKVIIGKAIKQQDQHEVLMENVEGSWKRAKSFIDKNSMELRYFGEVNFESNNIVVPLTRNSLDTDEDNYHM